MKIGTMQGVLGDPLSEVFAAAKRLGFDGVEVDWGSGRMAGEGGALAKGRRSEIRRAAGDAGVEIASVAAHFLNSGGLASPLAEKRSFGLLVVETGIEICHDLGAGVLLVPFFGEGAVEGREGESRLAEGLAKLAPVAEAAGVTLGIEHTMSGADAATLLDSVGSSAVRDYWDMANCFCFGYDPVEEVHALSGRLAQVHAKEFWDDDGGPAGTREAPRYEPLNKRPFGQGKVPVADVLAALRETDYDGWVVLETGAFGDPHGSAKAALDLLVRVLRQY